MATFRELEEKSDLSVEELKAILEEYAESGQSISSRVVIILIRRFD